MAVVRILPALLDLLLHDPVLLIQLLDVVVGLTKSDFLDGAAASTPESCKKKKKCVLDQSNSDDDTLQNYQLEKTIPLRSGLELR